VFSGAIAASEKPTSQPRSELGSLECDACPPRDQALTCWFDSSTVSTPETFDEHFESRHDE